MSDESTRCQGVTAKGEQCKHMAQAGREYCHLHGPNSVQTGRPSREFSEQDRKFVQTMVAAGVTRAKIAEVLDCSEDTLRKHCGQDLKTADARANAAVVATLFQMATSGKNTSATIFWLKSRMGWSSKGQRRKKDSQSTNLTKAERKALIEKLKDRVENDDNIIELPS